MRSFAKVKPSRIFPNTGAKTNSESTSTFRPRNRRFHVFFHIADEEVTTAKTVIHGIIAGVPLPFPVPDDNACHVMKCPIAAGTTEIYSPSLKCEPSYPKVFI